MDTIAALLLGTAIIWVPVTLWLIGKVMIPILTGKNAGWWSADRQDKAYDRKMEIAALQHRRRAAAAQRYINKNGTGWIEGR